MPGAVLPDPSGVSGGPDLDGWKDAQNRLIDALGNDVEFHVPNAPTYAAGVQLDPESGEPYDPLVVPTSGGDYEVVLVHCIVVFKTIRFNFKDPIFDTPSGLRRGEDVAFLVKPQDMPDIENANEIVLNDLTYKITEVLPDGLVDTDRFIIFGEAR